MGSTIGNTGSGVAAPQVASMHQVFVAAGQTATLQAQQGLIKQLREIQKETYEHASAYSKVILGMGYAGAFGIWAATRQYLTPSQTILVALGLCASLLCYVAFEVYQTICQGILIWRLDGVANSAPQNIGEAVQEFQRRNSKHSRAMMLLWWVTAVLAIAFALFAVGILFYAFIVNLLKIWR